jgi:hypothetical protein
MKYLIDRQFGGLVQKMDENADVGVNLDVACKYGYEAKLRTFSDQMLRIHKGIAVLGMCDNSEAFAQTADKIKSIAANDVSPALVDVLDAFLRTTYVLVKDKLEK